MDKDEQKDCNNKETCGFYSEGVHEVCVFMDKKGICRSMSATKHYGKTVNGFNIRTMVKRLRQILP